MVRRFVVRADRRARRAPLRRTHLHCDLVLSLHRRRRPPGHGFDGRTVDGANHGADGALLACDTREGGRGPACLRCTRRAPPYRHCRGRDASVRRCDRRRGDRGGARPAGGAPLLASGAAARLFGRLHVACGAVARWLPRHALQPPAPTPWRVHPTLPPKPKRQP